MVARKERKKKTVKSGAPKNYNTIMIRVALLCTAYRSVAQQRWPTKMNKQITPSRRGRRHNNERRTSSKVQGLHAFHVSQGPKTRTQKTISVRRSQGQAGQLGAGHGGSHRRGAHVGAEQNYASCDNTKSSKWGGMSLYGSCRGAQKDSIDTAVVRNLLHNNVTYEWTAARRKIRKR